MNIIKYVNKEYWIEHELSVNDFKFLLKEAKARNLKLLDETTNGRFGLLSNLKEVELIKDFFGYDIDFQSYDWIYFISSYDG